MFRCCQRYESCAMTAIQAKLRQALLSFLFFLKCPAAAKLRSWLGPDSFIEGEIPSSRSNHGFTFANEELYVFGGLGQSGNWAH